MVIRTRTVINCAAAVAVGLAASIATPALATARPAPSIAAGRGGALRLTSNDHAIALTTTPANSPFFAGYQATVAAGPATVHAFGQITATPISTRTFAGYQTAVTAGSATSSAATLTLPALSCTTAATGIAADAGVAANNFKSYSIAGVFTGCSKGKAVYFPWLLANGTEANYTSTPFAAGDVINLSASVTTSGITVQVTDVTKGVGVTNTITGAGASGNAAWIGDDSWYSSTGTLLGVPNFGTLTFTNAVIDGKTLQSWNPQQYQRVNSTGIVQIATGALSTSGNAFATSYKHS